MTMPNPTTVRAALAPIATRLLAQRIEAERLKSEMDAIDAELLANAEYTCTYTQERITDPDRAWTMSTEQAVGYYSQRDDIIAERYTVPQRGFCPASMASHAVIGINRELIDAAGAFIPDMSWSLISGQTKETRERATDLVLKLALHPYAVTS
jgi:hypothetical protein